MISNPLNIECRIAGSHSLIAHVLRLLVVVQTTSVMHGDLVAGLGEVLAIAGFQNLLGDAHSDSEWKDRDVYARYELVVEEE